MAQHQRAVIAPWQNYNRRGVNDALAMAPCSREPNCGLSRLVQALSRYCVPTLDYLVEVLIVDQKAFTAHSALNKLTNVVELNQRGITRTVSSSSDGLNVALSSNRAF